MTVEEQLGAQGRRALARLGSRLTLAYLVAAAAGVLLGAPAADRAGVAPLAAGVLVCAVVAGVAVDRLAPPRPPGAHAARAVRRTPVPVAVVAALGAGAVSLCLVGAASAALGPGRATMIVGWVVPGVALGLALAHGPLAGGMSLLSLAGVLLSGRVGLDRVDLPAIAVGDVVTVLVGVVLRLGAVRGNATTETALAAAAAADVARTRAAARLKARRRLDRALHDTLLSTLTLLAHGGTGVDAGLLRTACRRDLVALRSDRWAEPADLAGLDADVDADALGRSRPVRVPDQRRRDPLTDHLAAVRTLAAGRGLDLRVHAPPPAASLAPAVLDAWSGALTECVANVVRHAGVAAADVAVGCTDDLLVTVVVDEGTGFDPAAAPTGRLGLAASVRERVLDVGGDVRLWSSPGQGTVVELVVPLRAPVGTGSPPGSVR